MFGQKESNCDAVLWCDIRELEAVGGIFILLVVVDVNNLKNGRKPLKLQKESLAGCAGEC